VDRAPLTSQMPDFEPRKLPRQERSRVTYEAMLEACARLLREEGYDALTTTHVAERAGVSVGTLYEFFPNKESIVAALIEQRAERLVADTAAHLDSALAIADIEGAAAFLIRSLIALVTSDRELYRVVFQEVPFSSRLPALQRAIAALFDLARIGGERAVDRVSLPHLDADTWLIARMLYQAVLEIAFAEDGAPDGELLTRELVRLSLRMMRGSD
jgi:AcrR family transcriptional regulator